jgi:hypothetical protein
MNAKAGSRDLDDVDIVDAADVIELSDYDDSDEKLVNNKKAVKVVKTEKSGTVTGPVARRPAADRIQANSTRSRARNNSQDLLANISQVLDPNLRRARTDEQSVNSLQTGQIFTLSSQLREAQRQTEAIRNQLSEAERRCQNAERRADRAELLGMISGSRSRQNFPRRPPSPVPHPRIGHQPSGMSSRRHFCQEIYFGDGGRSTRFLASDDDDADVQGFNDSPRTRRYTFEEKDQLEFSDHSRASTSPKPSSSSLPTSSSPIMMIVPPPTVSTESESPLRYPSLEV